MWDDLVSPNSVKNSTSTIVTLRKLKVQQQTFHVVVVAVARKSMFHIYHEVLCRRNTQFPFRLSPPLLPVFVFSLLKNDTKRQDTRAKYGSRECASQLLSKLKSDRHAQDVILSTTQSRRKILELTSSTSHLKPLSMPELIVPS